MDTPTKHTARTRKQHIQYLRMLPDNEVTAEFWRCLPEDVVDGLDDYMSKLSLKDQQIACRACLICRTATKNFIVPRPMQLDVVLADRRGSNSLVSAGTGSGKTLPIALNILLDDPAERSISLTLSPLKRLQVTQDDNFNNNLVGVPTVTINEDTPRNASWWSKNVWAPKSESKNPVRHLIVTVEQLFKTKDGNMPRLGEWLRERPGFQKLIKRINIDEAHFVYSAGESLYGAPAFRPAWGFLAGLKRTLPKRIIWHLFSATFPPHVLTHIRSGLLLGSHAYIRLTSNRANIMYATHQIVDKIGNLGNYNCFLASPFSLEAQPHVLIFADDQKLTARIADHLDSRLPVNMRDRGVVAHYHSDMSPEYLEHTHQSFVSPTGMCRILVTTSGQSVGVDFPNVKIVCTTGLPSSIIDALQRGGRAIRTGNADALFVIFYDEWARNISLEEYNVEGNKFAQDPDRPRKNLRDWSRREERAPLSLVSLVQSSTCLRELYAQYLGDNSPEARVYTTPFCCDRHSNGFNLQDYLPGPLFQSAESELPKDSTRNQPRPRGKAERLVLDQKVIIWVDARYLEDMDELMRTKQQILADDKRKVLIRMPTSACTSVEVLLATIQETVEWGQDFGQSLFHLIDVFDKEEEAKKKAVEDDKKAAEEAKRAEAEERKQAEASRKADAEEKRRTEALRRAEADAKRRADMAKAKAEKAAAVEARKTEAAAKKAAAAARKVEAEARRVATATKRHAAAADREAAARVREAAVVAATTVDEGGASTSSAGVRRLRSTPVEGTSDSGSLAKRRKM